VENSFSSFMACASGADMLLGAGLLHGSRILSYEQLVMDCEIYSMVRHMLQGIRITPETLALDEIRAVGPGGTFLPRKHTRTHMRELWLPELLDRRTYDEWVVKKDGAREWAGEKSRAILKNHPGEPLDPKLAEELKRIITSYEKK
jgi:trimethylamine--corrinoid protein Co-methyltransferase